MRRTTAATLIALTTLTTPALAAGPAPVRPDEPIEQELFDSWIGKYQDLSIDDLWIHRGLKPLGAERPLSFAPAKAAFYDRVVAALGLSPAARARLGEDGVVLVPQARHYSMAAAYYELYTKDLPLLVTTDSILDAMHRSFDAILAELEETALRGALERALRAVHGALPGLAKATPALAEAARDVDLYLTVALNLLEADPDHGRLLTAPKLVAPALVAPLLAKVASLQLENPGFGTDGTSIYGGARAVDWSQYKPRGHYARSERLQRYFRAMMWLGRADSGFLLERPRELRAAALLSALFASTGADRELQVLRDVVDLMVGRSDDLGPAELVKVLVEQGLADPAALAPDAAMTRLADALAASGLGAQRIRSQLVVSPPSDPRKAALPPVFQLFGQRFVIDGFVLSKVVYDDIVFHGKKQERRMPTGLDVMAALGNDLALRLLSTPGGELATWNYAANLAAVGDVVTSWSAEHWQDSLYDRWLDALRSLSAPPRGEHVPEVMTRGAWAAKMLDAQLASWAQLRHDTILYAKQSYTASVGCLYPKGFVEPYPVFYGKLEAFASEAQRRLAALAGPALSSAAVDRYTRYFGNFAAVMARLRVMADKELRGAAFDAAEEAFLKDTIERHMVNGGYAPTPDWSGWYVGLVFDGQGDEDSAVLWKPTIADVHTDPDAGVVLEVGTGNVDFAVVAIDNDGDRAIHVGPTFTYYELQHPAADRLTDEAWTELVATKPPARPAWITRWVVP